MNSYNIGDDVLADVLGITGVIATGIVMCIAALAIAFAVTWLACWWANR
jgi:hypothetical protein